MAHLWKKRRRTNTMMSDINVTPFVDVMLVLLIIFMVTAPLAKFGFDVHLPKVEASPVVRDEKWIITVDKNHAIYLNESEIKLEALEKRLVQLTTVNPQVDVFLRADESLPYGFVMRVMGNARRAGVRNLGMVTEPVPLPLKEEKK